MKIIKESGETEEFERDKFCGSLRESGAPDSIISEVCAQVAQEIQPGMSTTQLFRKASRYLMKKNLTAGIRYNLKLGIALLGPAGFLFEQFIETLLQAQGYETERNRMIEGECVEHEIDISAMKDDVHYIVEVKYHNQKGIKTPIDVVMYADARREDIARAERKAGVEASHKLILVTNTKFSSHAVKYAHCRDIELIGWTYPHHKGLENLISEYVLYPTTILPSVDRVAREAFAFQNMMLVRDLAPYSAKQLEKDFAIDERRSKRIIREAHALIYGKSAEQGA